MTRQRLETLLSRFSDVSILVMGDYFLDKYVALDPDLTEVSVETGLDAYQVAEIRTSPGAVGTVANNLSALGVGTIQALTVIGQDGEGYDLKRGLSAIGVRTDGVIETPELFTPTYMKPMMREKTGEREMNRLDTKNRKALPSDVEDQVIARLRELAPQVQAIIIGDQVHEANCGVMTERVKAEITAIGQERPDLFILADSRARIGTFRDVVLKSNRSEAAHVVVPGHTGPIDRVLAERCARTLFERTGRPVIVTLSEEGTLIVTADGCTPVAAIPVSGPIDPCGAGDSTTAGLVASVCAGATLNEGVLVGHLTASITVQQLGTTGTASPEQLLRRYDERFGE